MLIKHLSTFIILIISIILMLFAPMSNFDFYLMGLLTSALTWVVYIACFDLLMGYTGMLNFGQLLFAGFAAYTVALIELNLNLFRPLAILCGITVGTCSSLLIGLPSLRVRSSYFALVSFVVPLVFHRITLTFTEVFGGDYGISIERPFSKEGIYFTSILLMAGTLIAIKAIVNSRVGMALKSIREDEDTARAVGINVKKYKLIACLISAFFTSLAGICGLYDRGHVGPEIFSMHGSFNVVIMAIIGGVGTVYGAALGGGLLSILLEFMRPIAEFRTLIYSILLVFIVMMAPAGIWGGIAKYLRR